LVVPLVYVHVNLQLKSRSDWCIARNGKHRVSTVTNPTIVTLYCSTKKSTWMGPSCVATRIMSIKTRL